MSSNVCGVTKRSQDLFSGKTVRFFHFIEALTGRECAHNGSDVYASADETRFAEVYRRIH
jgi:hypothetical protein